MLRLFAQRKVGKGDPVKYLRDINWQDLGKQSATEVKTLSKVCMTHLTTFLPTIQAKVTVKFITLAANIIQL
ncbi:hypothetical protein TW73_02005 [Pseudoalteromonas piscicida]|nr:hypothetical protein TW73_02005 [Pseudoalteromonas piscicida]